MVNIVVNKEYIESLDFKEIDIKKEERVYIYNNETGTITHQGVIGRNKEIIKIEEITQIEIPEVESWKYYRDISVCNIVATADIGHEIIMTNLERHCKKSKMVVEYKLESFSGMIIRYSKGFTCSYMVFRTGKLNILGCKNESQLKKAVTILVDLLEQSMDIKISMRKFNEKFIIQNIVATTDLCRELNLYTLVFKLSNVEYEPETFPGLIYKYKGDSITFLIFHSGKVVCVGAKNMGIIRERLMRLEEELDKFKRTKFIDRK